MSDDCSIALRLSVIGRAMSFGRLSEDKTVAGAGTELEDEREGIDELVLLS